MRKILILAGSPRKGGNTDRLVEAFVKGAGDGNEVEIISVADYKVNPCIGCNSCFTREENRCFQDDDMTCATSVQKEYYETIQAPEKEFFLYKGCAHSPIYEDGVRTREILKKML
jgi:hypothetical protein